MKFLANPMVNMSLVVGEGSEEVKFLNTHFPTSHLNDMATTIISF